MYSSVANSGNDDNLTTVHYIPKEHIEVFKQSISLLENSLPFFNVNMLVNFLTEVAENTFNPWMNLEVDSKPALDTQVLVRWFNAAKDEYNYFLTTYENNEGFTNKSIPPKAKEWKYIK